VVSVLDTHGRFQRKLALEGNRLVGEIGPLTANQVLRFTVEAAESETHTVLYRGTAIAKVQPYRATVLTIDLQPVAPLVKFTPSYLETAPGLRFSVDTRLFNLTSAYGVSYRVTWATPLGLVVDSVVPNPAIENDTTVIFFAQPGGGTAPDSYYAFSITETDTTSVIVDPAGDLDMVRLYFRLPLMYAGPAAFELSLEVTSLTENQNGQIVDLPVGTLYIDDCRVEIPLDYVAGR